MYISIKRAVIHHFPIHIPNKAQEFCAWRAEFTAIYKITMYSTRFPLEAIFAIVVLHALQQRTTYRRQFIGSRPLSQ